MGGIFGVVSKNSCVMDLFFGIDYHSHLGTRRGGMAVYDPEKGFDYRKITVTGLPKKVLPKSGADKEEK